MAALQNLHFKVPRRSRIRFVQALQRGDRMSYEVRLQIAYQLATELRELHIDRLILGALDLNSVDIDEEGKLYVFARRGQRLAPELKSTLPSIQSDLYALGSMLYEIFTDRTPQLSRDGASIVSPRRFDPQLSPTIDLLIFRLLSPDVENRPGSSQVVQMQILAELETLRRGPSRATISAWINRRSTAKIVAAA